MNFLKSCLVLVVLMIFGVQETRAQWTYSSPTATGDCASLPAALTTGFTVAPLISRALFTAVAPLRIVKLAFWVNPATGKTDLFLAEKGGSNTAGRVLYYNGNANTLTAIGTIPNVSLVFNEQGVIGIALNQRTFAQDNFLYLMYSIGTGSTASSTNGWRISRYKVNPTTKVLDLTTEKILIHVPAGTANRWHTAGGMEFDNFGNLYIATGDNESTAMGPANTADLRAGILRITPDTTVARGYTIPAGNFGDYWAGQWESQGLTARAAAYRDTAIVKPEFYIKGTRNAYSYSLDPNRLGWIQWSECGPDAQREEEHNFTTKPAFSGWPFWAGRAVRQTAYASSYDEPNEPKTTAQWAAFNPSTNTTAVPVNNWAPATGYDTLPPMHVPFWYHTQGCAAGGPIVRYDGRISNPAKMPPHLDNTIIVTDQGSNNIWAVKVNPSTGAIVGTPGLVFTGTSFRSTSQPLTGNSVDFQQGPDGALYMVNWGAGCCNGDRPASTYEGVARITYTGTCQDSGLYPSGTTTAISKTTHHGDLNWLKIGRQAFTVSVKGVHDVRITNVQGRVVYSVKGDSRKDYNLPSNLSNNSLYFIQVKAEEGTATRGFLYQK